MKQALITRGGIETFPQFSMQTILLDFDGELTSYNGEILTVDHVEVEDSGLTQGRIEVIVARLNTAFASQYVRFTADPAEAQAAGEYSTIYLGRTSAFTAYGSFAGLAETVDHGNKNKTDKAFVMLGASSSDEAIIDTIAHEASHLIGVLDHGGPGLAAYAYSTIIVNSGITSNGLSVSSGNTIYVSGTANDTTVGYYGFLSVYGGTANDTAVYSSGHIYVDHGGTANDTTVFGLMSVYGGTVSATAVNSGGIMWIYGGTANETSVNSAGRMFLSGGTANSTTVSSGGYLQVDGYVASPTVNSTTINSGGTMVVDYGGTANETTIDSGGIMWIYGGTANETTVNSGGIMRIFVGGTATFAYNPWQGAIDSSNGADVTYLAPDANIYYGNNASGVLSKYDSLENFEIISGNSIVILGGTASDISVNSGGWMCISSGGIHRGSLQIENGAVVSAYAGAIIGFTVAGRTPGYDYLINDLFLISGNPSFSVTVSATQAEGRYTLAGGASGFSGTFSLGTGEENYGSITVNGNTLTHGLYTYTLMTEESSLFLTVDDGIAPEVLSVAPDTTAPTTGNVAVTAVFSENVARKQYSLDNSAWTVYTQPVVMPGNGTVYFRGIDAAGNISDAVSYEVTNIDRTAPVITLSGNNTTPARQAALTGSVDDGSKLHYRISGTEEWIDYAGPIEVSENAFYEFMATDALGNTGTASMTFHNIFPELPQNLAGSATGLSWESAEAPFAVEFSTDDFAHALRIETAAAALDSLNLPQGTYQWRVCSTENGVWVAGENIAVEAQDTAPQVPQSDADGDPDLFFARSSGLWSEGYNARHEGTLNDWEGTGELVQLEGKNRISDIFEGSDDANVLVMTDDACGDALFLDDIYSAFPEAEQLARIAQIDEIRAGAGDDIVDLTSQRFAYEGGGMRVRGGLGDDVIWANSGNNVLFGDAGNDRLVGAAGDDIIGGGAGNDSMHGGGGDDTFTFGSDWGNDTVEQLADGKVTLWFESGSADNWNADTLAYTDGTNSVTVSGVTEVTLKFGDDGSEEFADLSSLGAFADATSEKIFEDTAKGLLA